MIAKDLNTPLKLTESVVFDQSLADSIITEFQGALTTADIESKGRYKGSVIWLAPIVVRYNIGSEQLLPGYGIQLIISGYADSPKQAAQLWNKATGFVVKTLDHLLN